MNHNILKKIINFFLDIPEDTWRDVVLSSIFIPLVFYLATKLRIWIVSLLPINKLFSGYRETEVDILIFISQLSGANSQSQLVQNQVYISRFPQPLPTNQNNLGIRSYQNIDPVWSQSDGQCVAEVFNILGRINKQNGFKIADIIRDWNHRLNTIFSIGFNPKTHDLLSHCSPINFELIQGENLSIKGQNLTLGATYPDDAGIIQKHL